VFLAIVTINRSTSRNSINRSVSALQYVFYEVGAKLLNIIYINVRLQRVNTIVDDNKRKGKP
jgi:hypothetical protein